MKFGMTITLCMIGAGTVILSSAIDARAATMSGRRATDSMPELERYLSIVERKPFGEVSPSEPVAPTATAPAQETFARNLEMRAIIDDGFTMRVGFLDTDNQKNFYISLGETVDGIELVSVDYDNEEALVRKGLETSLFSLRPQREQEETRPMGAPPVTRQTASRRRRPSFADITKQVPDGHSPPESFQAFTPFRGKNIEDFIRENPEAAMKYPSPLRPPAASAPVQGRGETIERFLRENPDAVRRFSPFRPEDPSSRVEGRGEIIERFQREHSGEEHMEPPVPFTTSPESVPFLFEDLLLDDEPDQE